MWEVLQEIAKGSGVAAVTLAIVAFGVRAFWPFFKRQVEATQKVLQEQLAESKRELRESHREYMVAIERRDEISREIAKQLSRVADRIEKMDGHPQRRSRK